MTTIPERKLMTLKEAADWLNVPPSWIYQRTYCGSSEKIPFIKLGRLLRFDPIELGAWIDERRNAA